MNMIKAVGIQAWDKAFLLKKYFDNSRNSELFFKSDY